MLAVALAAILMCPGVQAAGIPVETDSGTLGGFTLTNAGISGGVTTLTLTLLNPASESLQTINGVAQGGAGIPAAFEAPITLLVTPTGGGNYSITLSPATYTKTFGTGSSSAELTYNLTAGVTPLANFFNLTGLVTSMVTDALPGFTFAPFNAGGINNITLTATSFMGANSFASVISTVGASATGSGAFSEVAIPEPVSLTLMGIGLSGLFTFRRFFKRTSVA
jgi:hypothetical protein